jgi:DNA polymerase-3 subunit epsilon
LLFDYLVIEPENKKAMIEYKWWGSENSPPDNLKTKKQLSEMGLSPVKPIGFIKTQKYNILLYDINDPTSVRPKKKLSDKHLEGIRKGAKKRRLTRILKDSEYRYQELKDIEEWANKILSEKFLILDTETTGLDFSEIVEIAIIDQNKQILMNTLVKPIKPIPRDAIEIHGISNEMVVNAPSFKDIHHELFKITYKKKVLIYNAVFDNEILRYNSKINNLAFPEYKSECLMKKYAIFYGEYSDYHRGYKWQKLEGGHRALDDCFASYDLLIKMAQDIDIYYHLIPCDLIEFFGVEYIKQAIQTRYNTTLAD